MGVERPHVECVTQYCQPTIHSTTAMDDLFWQGMLVSPVAQTSPRIEGHDFVEWQRGIHRPINNQRRSLKEFVHDELANPFHPQTIDVGVLNLVQSTEALTAVLARIHEPVTGPVCRAGKLIVSDSRRRLGGFGRLLCKQDLRSKHEAEQAKGSHGSSLKEKTYLIRSSTSASVSWSR